LEESLRRGWVFLGALGYLGVACFPVLPKALHRPIGMVAQWSTVMGGFLCAKLTPKAFQQVVHPLVVCAAATHVGCRVIGPAVPFQLEARNAGDRLFQLLPAAMAALGVRMYNTSHLWYEDSSDFNCVVVASSAAGLFSMVTSLIFSVAPQSPLHVPPPMSLPLLQRCVMTALGLESSKTIGPPCDGRMSVAGALITGCLGASFGSMMLKARPDIFDNDSPVVRGVATGCSGVSTGTASLIGSGDVEAGAIAGAAMCLAGAVHTMSLQVPGVVPAIRAMASLPAVA
jgi:putative effector of murein hydrolase